MHEIWGCLVFFCRMWCLLPLLQYAPLHYFQPRVQFFLDAISAEQTDRCCQFGRICYKKCLKSPHSLSITLEVQLSRKPEEQVVYLSPPDPTRFELGRVVLGRPLIPQHLHKAISAFSMARSIKHTYFLIAKGSKATRSCRVWRNVKEINNTQWQ